MATKREFGLFTATDRSPALEGAGGRQVSTLVPATSGLMRFPVALLVGDSACQYEPRPEDLRSSFGRGMAFLLGRMEWVEDGGGYRFASPVESRILETALTLHLLRKEHCESTWQEHLRSYLLRHRNEGDEFSQMVAAAVLGGQQEECLSRARRFMGQVEYSKRRKYALMLMLLAEVGACPLDVPELALLDPSEFGAQASHRFSQMYGAALRLLHARHRGTALVGTEDATFLRESQAANGSWEQQTLITLVALLGLGREAPAFERGLAFLRRLAREDGGIPFCNDQNVWLTALAGLVLQEAAPQTRELQHQVARYLVSRQHQSGGWSFTEDVMQTDTDNAANCVQFLSQLDEELYGEAIDRTHRYFLSLQRDDGGYPTYEPAGESEVTMTANIMLAQSLVLHRHPHLLAPLRRAFTFLVERQRDDGRFERSWSLSESYSIFRVLWALRHCRGLVYKREVRRLHERALGYLLQSQQPDGGWGYHTEPPAHALGTAYALASLTRIREHCHVEQATLDRGLHFLLSQQDAIGEFHSPPDLAGPRPIAFKVPLLSTVFSLVALTWYQDDALASARLRWAA